MNGDAFRVILWGLMIEVGCVICSMIISVNLVQHELKRQ